MCGLKPVPFKLNHVLPIHERMEIWIAIRLMEK